MSATLTLPTQHFAGSLESLMEARTDLDLLAEIIGRKAAEKLYHGRLSEVTHKKMAVAAELIKRSLAEQLNQSSALNSPREVRDYLRLHLARRDREVFVMVLLDAQHRVLKTEDLFLGTLNQTSVYPREVVKCALRNNAAAVIFAHNHPSGVAEPSHADELLTRSLKSALSLVDVQVLDHFIVTFGAVMSFAERGLL